ncbi:MAG: TIGR02996 domain-containing protein [Myxococcota bacterium]|nr:TIGR02996 domain-containing protein [Myxococcota bacterium]
MREVSEAIERKDFEVALVEAVSAWRTDRHAVLAELVDAIAAKCRPAALAGRTKAAFQKAWLALAKRAATTDDPAAIAALVAALVKSLPGGEPTALRRVAAGMERPRALLKRLQALALCADDPRVATALVESILVKAPFSVDDASAVYGPVLVFLIELGDERSITELRALAASPLAKTQTIRNYFARELPKAADAIEKRLKKRPAFADAARAKALIAELGTKAPDVFVAKHAALDVDALVAECIAHPDDDGPREVLADALLEREDPRGAFIHLQLRDARGALDETERKQMASLQRKHEKTWLGDLGRCTKLRAFRRGFIEEAELLQGAAADAATWKRVAADPIVATIRTLHKGSASEELYRSFVFSPAMRLLREMDVPSTAMLRAIPRRIEHIKLSGGLTKDALAAIDEVVRKTGATRLSFEVRKPPADVLAQLADWEPRKHFVELGAMPHYRSAPDWFTRGHEWLQAFEKLAPVQRLGIERVGERLTVERGKRGLVIEIRASQELWMRTMLDKRLRPIERLVVRGTPDPWSKPTAWFKGVVKKLRAAKTVVEVRDGWQPFA